MLYTTRPRMRKELGEKKRNKGRNQGESEREKNTRPGGPHFFFLSVFEQYPTIILISLLLYIREVYIGVTGASSCPLPFYFHRHLGLCFFYISSYSPHRSAFPQTFFKRRRFCFASNITGHAVTTWMLDNHTKKKGGGEREPAATLRALHQQLPKIHHERCECPEGLGSIPNGWVIEGVSRKRSKLLFTNNYYMFFLSNFPFSFCLES